MSERKSRMNVLADAWTDGERSFGPYRVARPTSHRLNALLRRRNKWISEDPREQTDLESLAEWLFVLSRTKEEMTRLFPVPLAEWEGMIDAFLAEVDEDALEEFRLHLEEIMEGLNAGAVRDAEGGKTNRGKEPQSHAT